MIERTEEQARAIGLTNILKQRDHETEQTNVVGSTDSNDSEDEWALWF